MATMRSVSASRRATTGASISVSALVYGYFRDSRSDYRPPGTPGRRDCKVSNRLARSATVAKSRVLSQGVYAVGRGRVAAGPRYTAEQEVSSADETNRNTPVSRG